MASLGVAVELARLSLRHRQGRHRIGRARTRGRSGNHCHRRDQHPRPGGANRPADRRGRRARAGRLRRRAVEPVPAGDGRRPPAARRGRSGRDRRLPRLGMSGHAAGDAGFAQGRARPWDFAVRRRGRGAFRRRSTRRGGRFPEADLQLPRQPAEPRRRDRPLSAEGEGRPVDRHDLELRRRPRLSLPVLVLHDHQCAGAQVALPHRRRHRAGGARQSCQRRPLFLHHRRQSRP